MVGAGTADSEHGVALVEAAVVLPVLVLVVAGGLILGLATVADVRLEQAVGEAARGAAAGVVEEDAAGELVAGGGGTMTCFWSGSGPGGCWDDGLDVDRVQVVGTGPTFQIPFGGTVTPSARAVGVVS